MSKKKKCPPIPACEKWAVPLADFFSLLLALFIALYAIASVNTDKAKALTKEFVKIFDFPSTQVVEKESKTDGKHSPSNNEESRALQAQNINQQESIEKLKAILDQRENQFYMELPSILLFNKDETRVANSDDILYLKRIKMIMQGLGDGVQLEIRGFSDNDDSYLTSFDLATARAREVLEILIKSGVDSSKLSIKSYGANNPRFDNNSLESIKNNRVELYFKTDINDIKSQKTILDAVEKVK
ncbi:MULTISPECIES: flagellar motor protein MotB [unclassified Campylobacter]|uniref:flagellar motor protein MotB n=1 Tax=unclassified Campylobacter TaxID=2593542 RepID=UPI001BD93BD6|nr:flagellar motor protein MotB [Campylobacter sp. 2018MI13]MBZ7978425.1 flagellar motor protein MotB [Campylobacter sp. RM12654]MBZ7991697.1 flagellar motor protein MotB [Campylobacter sp. RM9331]MBZ7993421.1 flagellar motor protein MotB [Campylobacter sp. RM9333]MBZ8006171.1 flagellar motor protein MotB [Campylobacter sp. RM9332]MBT0883308.1 flagellar motor protein MotB [Campylobacter sp. 2018MI13]